MFVFSFWFLAFFMVFLALWCQADAPWKRAVLLNGAAILLYGVLSPPALVYLLAWSALIWGCMQIPHSRASVYLLTGLGAGSLLFWKFWGLVNFDNPNPHWLMPLGLSAFTFQGLSYFYEYRQGRLPKWNYLQLLSFCAFFPTVFSGPVQNARLWWQEQGKTHLATPQEMQEALGLVVMGCFYKLCISSYFSLFTAPVFNAPANYDSASLLLAAYAYSFELFHDFCGWSLIVEGMCLALGIRILKNFRQPYVARNIHQFWDLWHISLSGWFKNYVYIDLLGGNRVTESRKYLNIFITMVISGLWHGLNSGFLIWGLLHASSTTMVHFWKARSPYQLPRPLAVFLTFNFVTAAWIFFRAQDLNLALDFFRGMSGLSIGPSFYLHAPLVLLILFCMVWHKNEHHIQNRVEQWMGLVYAHPILAGLSLGCFMVLLRLVSPAGVPPFIYFGF